MKGYLIKKKTEQCIIDIRIHQNLKSVEEYLRVKLEDAVIYI